MEKETFAGMKEKDTQASAAAGGTAAVGTAAGGMTAGGMTAKEWIAQLRDYRGLKCRRVILENELNEARRDFDDARIAECRSALAALDADLERLERLADTYAPSDARPYKGSSFGAERAFCRCRYILGLSLEKTAELMDVSRATVFRISRYMKG